MLSNATTQINPKSAPNWAAAGTDSWGQLQHIKTLMGLSRRRHSKEEVLTLIDAGKIGWAWDISRRNSKRPEIRIWRESMVHYLKQEDGLPAEKITEELPVDQIIELILPRPSALATRAAVVSVRELQRRFLCCRNHIAGLVAEGELGGVGRSHFGRGGILRQSAFEFLKRRCVSI